MNKFLEKIKVSSKKDTFIKIAALFFAILLWNYVLSDTNPQRTKTVNDLSIKVLNEDILTSKQLVVTDGLSSILNSTSVNISVQKNYLDNVSEDNVQVEADLSGITAAGTYEIKLKAQTAYGTVTAISPSTLKITVDTVIKKTVPTKYVFIGAAKDNVYVSEPSLSIKQVEISGPSSVLNKITSAVCYIDLDTLQPSDKEQSASLQIYFSDEDGKAIDETTVKNYIKADTYSITAKYSVKNKKTVTVDISSSLLNQDKIKTGLEIKSTTVDPQTVTIVGTESALAKVDSLKADPVSLTGLSSDTIKKSTLIVPSGVTVLEGKTVNINILLQAKTTN